MWSFGVPRRSMISSSWLISDRPGEEIYLISVLLLFFWIISCWYYCSVAAFLLLFFLFISLLIFFVLLMFLLVLFLLFFIYYCCLSASFAVIVIVLVVFCFFSFCCLHDTVVLLSIPCYRCALDCYRGTSRSYTHGSRPWHGYNITSQRKVVWRAVQTNSTFLSTGAWHFTTRLDQLQKAFVYFLPI